MPRRWEISISFSVMYSRLTKSLSDYKPSLNDKICHSALLRYCLDRVGIHCSQSDARINLHLQPSRPLSLNARPTKTATIFVGSPITFIRDLRQHFRQ